MVTRALGRPLAAPALHAAVLFDVAELGLQLVDTPLDAPAVGLQLGLPRPSGADPPGLLAEPPAPAQSGKPVAELGQLHLGLALLAAGVLGKDVENHRGAVDGGATEDLLQVELLGRAQLVVEHHGVGVELLAHLQDLVDLALADVGGRIRRAAALDQPSHLVGPGGVDELGQLVQAGVGAGRVGPSQGDAHQHDLLPEGPLDERARLPAVGSEPASVGLVLSHSSPSRCIRQGRPRLRCRPTPR